MKMCPPLHSILQILMIFKLHAWKRSCAMQDSRRLGLILGSTNADA